MVCVNFLGEFLATAQADRTVDRLADHIVHIAEVIGVDRVGLGPDFIKEVSDDTTPPCCEDVEYARLLVPGLEGPRGLPLVTEALIRRGLPEADVEKILGGNVLELFRKELGRPA
ncbi:hypothetical protein GCM10017744_029490 [Streptomyces antimycoticus]